MVLTKQSMDNSYSTYLFLLMKINEKKTILGSLNSKTESFYNKHETSSESLECESEKRNGLKNRKKSSMKNSIICPSCGEESVLPSEGVLGLPLHYILQHKMVLASLNTSTTHLLCDLCPSEVSVRFILYIRFLFQH